MGDRGGGYQVRQILGLSCLLVALVLGWGGVGGFGVAGAAGSGFRVGWGMAGGEGSDFSFSGGFCWCCRGSWALGYHSMRFRHFSDVS